MIELMTTGDHEEAAVDREIRQLHQRVGRLELQVAALQGTIPSPPPPHVQARSAGVPVPVPPGPRRVKKPPRPELEAAMVGTWLARIGALAVLTGAGFVFAYAVQWELIRPAAR